MIRNQPMHSLPAVRDTSTPILSDIGKDIPHHLCIFHRRRVMHLDRHGSPREQLHGPCRMTIQAVVFVMSIEGGIRALEFDEGLFEQANPQTVVNKGMHRR